MGLGFRVNNFKYFKIKTVMHHFRESFILSITKIITFGDYSCIISRYIYHHRREIDKILEYSNTSKSITLCTNSKAFLSKIYGDY